MNMVEYVLARSRLGRFPVVVWTGDMPREAINALTTLFPHIKISEDYGSYVYFTEQQHIDDYLKLLEILE